MSRILFMLPGKMMSKTRWVLFACVLLSVIVIAGGHSLAQQGGQQGGNRGKGRGDWGKKGRDWDRWKKGGKGDTRLPELQIEDVKPDGMYEVLNLLPGSQDQPRMGVSDKIAWRLVNYEKSTHTVKFAVLDLEKKSISSRNIKLPPECPALGDSMTVGCDGGQYAVISQQAATVFVDVAGGKVKVASGFEGDAPKSDAPPPRRRGWRRGDRPDWGRDQPTMPAEAYRVHSGAGGRNALSLKVTYDQGTHKYTGNGAMLHQADGRSIALAWPHDRFGVPPRDRDAVFAVNGDEIVVLVMKPKTPGAFNSSTELSCLVFDGKGTFKEAQTSTENWHGGAASRATLSPNGVYIVAHPEDGLSRYVIKRGTWERGYKTDYDDPCIGFTPEGDVGVFIENLSPQRAAIKAIKLANAEVLWSTSLKHEEVQGRDQDEPFSSVGPGASAVAATHGIIAGVTAENASYIYTAKVVDFEPLSMAYDSKGKLVAALSLDRVFVLDARTREETHSISFEKQLPNGAMGEFVAFDSKSKKILACVRNQGSWLIDLDTQKIEATVPPVPGTWARPLPDLSGIVYTVPKDEGGNVMIQPVAGGEPVRLYRCEYKDTLAICLWVGDKGDEFLITERDVGEGKLFLINDKGDKTIEYNVAEVDTTYTGDRCITAFVGRGKQAVLINEVTQWGYTGINCSVISPGDGEPIDSLMTAVFQTGDLPGKSTYGVTAASPFFGAQHWGNEKFARFACPAGVLEADIGKGLFKLYAWSRKPSGIAAINPKANEFFVAGSVGLTTYKLK